MRFAFRRDRECTGDASCHAHWERKSSIWPLCTTWWACSGPSVSPSASSLARVTAYSWNRLNTVNDVMCGSTSVDCQRRSPLPVPICPEPLASKLNYWDHRGHGSFQGPTRDCLPRLWMSRMMLLSIRMEMRKDSPGFTLSLLQAISFKVHARVTLKAMYSGFLAVQVWLKTCEYMPYRSM
jgi:hypothetical protein